MDNMLQPNTPHALLRGVRAQTLLHCTDFHVLLHMLAHVLVLFGVDHIGCAVHRRFECLSWWELDRILVEFEFDQVHVAEGKRQTADLIASHGQELEVRHVSDALWDAIDSILADVEYFQSRQGQYLRHVNVSSLLLARILHRPRLGTSSICSIVG